MLAARSSILSHRWRFLDGSQTAALSQLLLLFEKFPVLVNDDVIELHLIDESMLAAFLVKYSDNGEQPDHANPNSDSKSNSETSEESIA